MPSVVEQIKQELGVGDAPSIREEAILYRELRKRRLQLERYEKKLKERIIEVEPVGAVCTECGRRWDSVDLEGLRGHLVVEHELKARDWPYDRVLDFYDGVKEKVLPLEGGLVLRIVRVVRNILDQKAVGEFLGDDIDEFKKDSEHFEVKVEDEQDVRF